MIRDFVEMSKYAGMREDIIQAGGGNSSVKLKKDKMLIKSSGVQMADITETYGYSVVNPQIITEYFTNPQCGFSEQQLLEKCLIDGMRPSIETFLHSITDVFTLHTHPMIVNVLTAQNGGMDILRGLFPEALFVGYATPGIKLAEAYFKAYQETAAVENQIFDIIFLKNHGLIVSDRSAQNVIRKMESILLKIEKYLSHPMDAYHSATKLYNVMRNTKNDNNILVYLSRNIEIQQSMAKYGEKLWKLWFCPDCIVYCGKRPLVLQHDISQEYIEKHMSLYGTPIIIYYNSNLYILANSIKKAKEIESVLSFSAQVALLNDNCHMDLLSEEEQNYLLNWESEKYRKYMK